MAAPQTTDRNLAPADVAKLASADALAGFFAALGYDTGMRKPLTPEAIGLTGETAAAVREIELLAEDEDGFLRVLFVRIRSLTAKSRNDLARILGRTSTDHLLVLTSDFGTLEFVLLDKRRRDHRGPGGIQRVQVVPLTLSVDRKGVGTRELRMLRRFTWTARDGLEQFDKLRSVFEAAAFSEDYFCNRALFADHYLLSRLREDPAWRENPTQPFLRVKSLMDDSRRRWTGKGEQIVRDELYGPLFEMLGFQVRRNKKAEEDRIVPDYLLCDADGRQITAAFTYAWDRWLDGPDHHLDPHTPDENPGAAVVSALDEGVADWIIVTNGRQWRLYSRQAHSRATNFYEVDLPEALVASGDTDPNEAFRYWWLFFRADAFQPVDAAAAECWLDRVAQGSRDYAKQLGERLKDRIFKTIFPHLAQGFLEDRRTRLGLKSRPTEDDLRDVFEATLTLLYRLLFLLYAESRDLLPVREAPYHEASLAKIKTEIAEAAGIAESEVQDHLRQAYSSKETKLYDRLQRLFATMDQGDPVLNVPTYNGGLFITRPEAADKPNGVEHRERRIARFLLEHKVPDRWLASAIDRLARDPDDKTYSLAFIDYKSLAVRHLGSIYEGLLEFKLRIAEEDLTTKKEKSAEKYISLKEVKPKRGRAAEVVVRQGEVYLSNDKAERKASGSYYTPDPIVEYIVEQTVGPVLHEKLEALRPKFRKVRKTFDNEVQKATAYPVRKPEAHGLQPVGVSETWDPREFALEKVYAAHQDLVEELFEFRVLDPAMGSGHFLVEAVDFLTDRLLTFLNQFPINPVSVMLDRTRRNILEALAEQGVSVDPAKLTDVNLLKRHVLKQCIYGVDLNPMAVELAKVSLWLDAFTLGAPLSFLDHHLRCGNSLIGATFADLKAATKSRLFGVDYEPLLRAIRHVLFVNKMADATAAEVKQSASQYDQARKELSGYQIVLDLLVARHFGHPQAAELLTHAGRDLDLSSRQAFLKSVEDLEELTLINEVTQLARRPDLRFFHWEIEFPEVFFGFADTDQRRIEHKNEIAAGSAGFDAAIGNPPYVRQETIKAFKEFLKANYGTFNSTNDLYVYFQEREVQALRAEGRMGMIVANKWMRAGYGAGIRRFLHQTARPLEVVDFGHSPIFPDADTFPCILIVARRLTDGSDGPSADGEEMAVCPVPRENWNEKMDLAGYVASKRYRIPTRLLREEGWSLEDPQVQALLERVRNTGVPLKEYCGGGPYRGPVSGFNDAFYIDAATRDRLIREDARSAEIIKPLLRGRDIDRWRPRPSDLYLIFAKRGIDIDHYPAIKRHLSQFRERLEPKPRDWTDRQGKWSGRAAGSYQWYELQASPGEEFEQALSSPKIVYQEIQFHSWYALETNGAFVNNKVFLLPTDNLALLGVLCSPLMWWHLTRVLPHMKDEALCPAGFVMEQINVTTGTPAHREKIRAAVEPLLSLTDELHGWETEYLAAAREQFGTPEADDRLIDWLPLASDTFATRCTKLLDGQRPTAATIAELTRFQQTHRARQVDLLTRQLALEQTLSDLVEDAYGLTPEERSLLHATRPVRDPLDVLRARSGQEGIHDRGSRRAEETALSELQTVQRSRS